MILQNIHFLNKIKYIRFCHHRCLHIVLGKFESIHFHVNNSYVRLNTTTFPFDMIKQKLARRIFETCWYLGHHQIVAKGDSK